MSYFHDLAEKYIEQGYLVTPVINKAAYLDNWASLDEDEILASDFSKANGIGLLCGKSSGVICLDIDRIQKQGITDNILQELNKLLPPIMCAKKGDHQKPPARFFQYNDEKARKFIYLGIEILSDGNQTVLPESMHPNGYLYEYSHGNLLNIDADDLPILDPNIIDWLDRKNQEIKRIIKQEKKKSGMSLRDVFTPETGRCAHNSHNHLSAIGVAMCYAGDSFEYIVERLLLEDEKINKDSDYLYFQCPSRKEFRGLSIREAANEFVQNIFDNHKHLADKKNSTIHINDTEYNQFVLMFEDMFPWHKKCALSGETFTKKTIYYAGQLCEMIGESEEKLVNVYSYKKSMRSYAVSYGLKPNRVVENFERWVSSMKPEILVDIPKWDGVDRIAKIFEHVAVKIFSREDVANIFKYWLSNAIRRAMNPDIQNETIILHGDQGIGKDNLVNNLLRAFKNTYYNSVQIDSMNPKNTYESLEGTIYAYIPEQDEMSGARLAFVKDLITGTSKKIRKAYAEKAEKIDQTWSFITSSNFDDMLKDPSGNRRYIIIDLEEIDFAYNEYLNDSQIAAQIMHLFQSGFTLEDSIRKKINFVRRSYEPEDKVDQACQIIAHEIISEVAVTPEILNNDFKQPYAKYRKIVDSAARSYRGISLNAIQRRLRDFGFTVRIGNRVYFNISEMAKYSQDSNVKPIYKKSSFDGHFLN